MNSNFKLKFGILTDFWGMFEHSLWAASPCIYMTQTHQRISASVDSWPSDTWQTVSYIVELR